MHETIGSLKVYFLVIGGLGVIGDVLALASRFTLLGVLLSAAGLTLAIAYLYIGWNMERLVSERPWRIQRVILATVLFSVLAVLVGMVQGATYSVYLLSGALVSWYLSISVREVAAVVAAAKEEAHRQ